MSPKKTSSEHTINNFYAILEIGEVRRINLTQDITGSVKNIFISAGAQLTSDGLDEVLFDGNYTIEEGEVLFVKMDLDERVLEVLDNSVGIPILNLK